MKNLTKLSILVLLCLFAYQSNAQQWTLKGGLNLSTMLDKDDDGTYSDEFSMKPGFHIGATVDLPISEVFSFQPGLLLTTKGLKYDDDFMGVAVKTTATLYYLDIPLNLKASFPVGEGATLYGAVGPYVDFGLSGKIKATGEYQGQKETETEDISWGSDEDEDDLKRLDLGLTFGGGVELNVLMFGISYDLGLTNISSYQEYGTSVKNRVLKFSVGYRF